MSGKHVVIFTGGRNRSSKVRPVVAHVLDQLRGELGDFTLIHGACGLESPEDALRDNCWQDMKGADRYADDWARAHPVIDLRRRPADWPRRYKAAGPERNRAMVVEALEIAPPERIHGVAFPDPAPSRGTWNCVNAMRGAGIEVDVWAHRMITEWLAQ